MSARDLNASRALLVLKRTILKREGRPPYIVVAVVPLRSRSYADGRVECKEDLNASLALLVLEHNIKKGR